jgi:hypothetical protein
MKKIFLTFLLALPLLLLSFAGNIDEAKDNIIRFKSWQTAIPLWTRI